jgi:hypothetical protein
VQVEGKNPTDKRYLDLVLDGRLTQDHPHRWFDNMIKRLMQQVGPLELRLQAARNPEVQRTRSSIEQASRQATRVWTDSSDSAERRAADAQVQVDTLGDLTLPLGAGLAISRLPMTQSGLRDLRQRKLSVRSAGAGQPGWVYHCRHGVVAFTFARRYVGRRFQVRSQLLRRPPSGVDGRPASGNGPRSSG